MKLRGRVLAFSRNLPYRLGGAELSLYEELKCVKNLSICYAPQSSSVLEVEGYQELSPDRVVMEDAVLFSRFFYLEYFYNRRVIDRALGSTSFDCLVAQNRWAPKAVLSAKEKGKTAYMLLRDESSIHLQKNYYKGLKRVVRNAYSAIELAWIKMYYTENLSALKAADKVYANSYFMQEKLWSNCRVDSEILFPKIDLDMLKLEYNRALRECVDADKKVIMIGDTYIKGEYVFREIARRFPNVQFGVYGKGRVGFKEMSNLTHLGWVSSPAEAFAQARVVIVPSVWDEAYGRVAVEANYLGIPTIVANVGGLPEAVNFDESLIANGVEDFVVKLARLI